MSTCNTVIRSAACAVLSAGLLPVVAVAAGETVPCPQKKAGQWFRFAKTDLYNKTTEQLTKIDSVEGDRLFITEDGQQLITDKMHNWSKLGERTATPKYYVQIECPFSLGETRIYKDVNYDATDAGGSKARGTMAVTVAPVFESLTVKAGSFKAVKIVSDNNYQASKGPGHWGGSGQVVSYYAPEIGIWVKAEWTGIWMNYHQNRFRDGFELLEYSVGD